MEILSDYTLSGDMEIQNLSHKGGTINLNGHVLKIYGNYDGCYGGISFAGGSVYCEGNFTIYIYEEAGTYTVRLMVMDAAGNSDTAVITVTILEKDGNGLANITVTNTNGEAIPYADVAVKVSEDNVINLKADAYGCACYAGATGDVNIAAYADGYLPSEITKVIEEYEITECTVTLKKSELVVGNLTAKRMTYEEILAAGIDLSNPANINTFAFTFTVAMEQTPIPEVYTYNGGTEGYSSPEPSKPKTPGGGNAGEKEPVNGSGGYTERQVKQAAPNQPVLAFVSTSQSISWLKEMYNVNLEIVNAADSKYVITNSRASLDLPDGISIAKGSKTVNMGEIEGHSQASADWIIRGDKSGDYNIKAEFTGVLMPFSSKVSARFECETPITVNMGKGVKITIMPEESAFIGDNYYIQFKVENTSAYPLYNFSTTIPEFTSERSKSYYIDGDTGEKVCVTGAGDFQIPDPDKSVGALVTGGGDKLTFGVLNPGSAYYGTFVVPFSAEGDPDEIYYELKNYILEVTRGEDLGVDTEVSPIPGHITAGIVKNTENVQTYTGDPVDLSSGSFTDEREFLCTYGATELSFDMYYDSRITKSGETGTGWSHGYEQRIEEHNGTIRYYTNPYSYGYFIKKEYTYGEYVCVQNSMSDYLIVKNSDGTYTVKAPNGDNYEFDSVGKLTGLKDNTGLHVSITRSANTMSITDDISQKSIQLTYNESGKITMARSDERLVTFTYDGNNLKSYTDAEGNTTIFNYGGTERIVSETNALGITYVTNEYDENGRVLRQINATGDDMQISYKDDETATEITVTDENGTTKKMYVDGMEQVKRVVNENGGITRYGYDVYGNQVSEKDAMDNLISREYDEAGNMVKYTDTGNLTTTMTYDDRQNLLSATNAEGNTAEYEYDENNRLISEKDYGGMVTTYTYDANGMPATKTVAGLGITTYSYEKGLKKSETDAMGNVTSYEYDEAGNLISVKDASGAVTSYGYDKNGVQIWKTDRLGGTCSYTYDCNKNMTSSVTAQGIRKTFCYDGNGRLTKEIYSDGTYTEYMRDAMGRKISEKKSDGEETKYEYDISGNITKETYPDGSAVTYAYDILNHRTEEADSDGNSIKYVYYPNGNISAVTTTDKSGKTLDKTIYTYNNAWKVITENKNGNITSRTYDAMGNVTSVSDALGNTVNYTYDIYGRLINERDAMGYETSYGYDQNGNCTWKTDAEGNTAYMEYDALGRMTGAYIKEEDGERRVTYKYDAEGNIVQTTDGEGNTTGTTYDADGNIISRTDGNGSIILKNTYDDKGNLKISKDADGVETEYEYDSADRLTSYTQNMGIEEERITFLGYDASGRNTSVTDPSGATASCAYDESGNLTEITNPLQGVTSYKYDGAGRMTEETITGSETDSTTSYEYDEKGQLKTTTDAEGRKTECTYDAAGRLTSKTDELGTISYTYDKNGNILTVSDENGTIERQYDKQNRVISYKDANGNTIKYSYDACGNVTGLTYPDGNCVAYTYYKNGYLHTVTDAAGTTIYTYDKSGNPATTIYPDGTVETDKYSPAGRLLSRVTTKDQKELSRYSYTYDMSGNITEKSETGETGLTKETAKTITMTYDTQNRMLTYNGEKIKYDKNGNMTYGPVNGKMTNLTYDCRNRLTKAGNTIYAYDAENNRTSAVTGTKTEEYITDTVTSQYSRVILIRKSGDRKSGDDSDSDSADSTIVLTYGNGLISETTSGTTLIHHYDNLGSTRYLTDMTGTKQAEYSYGTYGELLSGTPELTRYLYNGKYGVTTDENRLYYMRQRYYNTDIKRFINRDIITGTITNTQSLNRYSYVQGNPVNLTDPFGLSPATTNGGNSLTLIHSVLDFIGCTATPVGIGANLINAALYAVIDHDYGMAALSAVSAVTLGAGKIAAMGGKLTKASKNVETVGNLVSNATNFAVCATATAQIGSRMVEEYAVQGKELSGETLTEALSIGLNVAGMLVSGKGAVDNGSRLTKAISESGATRRMAGKVEGKSELIRVGRWMSKDEYDKMVESGYVQKPYNADQSYVANPADSSAFYKQARKGTLYVEFDVESSLLKQTKDGWAAIPGPNSMYSKLNVKKGLQPYEFPKVFNIELRGKK